jgi:hypothetical protein
LGNHYLHAGSGSHALAITLYTCSAQECFILYNTAVLGRQLKAAAAVQLASKLHTESVFISQRSRCVHHPNALWKMNERKSTRQLIVSRTWKNEWAQIHTPAEPNACTN